MTSIAKLWRPVRLLALIVASIMMVSLAGCGSSSESGNRVIFAVTDKALTATTASYTSVPLEMGYFGEEELDVTIQPVDTALAGVQAVATGQAFITYASIGAVAAATEQDDNIAVVGLTNGNIFRIVVPEDSPIQSIADLKGKTVGANTLTAVANLITKAALVQAGLDPEKDAEYLPVGYGAQAAEALRTDQIQAYSGYDGPNVVIGDLLGKKMRDLPTPLNDLTGTSALVVRKDSIRDEPDRVVGMLRAFFKAMVFSQENPEAAIEMHWKQFPQSKPAATDDEAALQQSIEILNKRLEITGGPGPTGKFGVQDDAAMQQTVDTFAEHGLISRRIDLKATGLIDYSLADQYNDFDADAVRKQAAEWKS